MSLMVVETSPRDLLRDLQKRSVSFQKTMPERSLPSQIVTCPRELLSSVICVERFASDLLKNIEEVVGCVKLKLMLPLKTYRSGSLWWRQSFVLVKDLREMGVDVDGHRFDLEQISEGEAVSVKQLESRHLEVTEESAHVAYWYPVSKTIKISAKVLQQAFQHLLFELTNASFNRKLRSIRFFPKEEQVEAIECLEFETTKTTRERLEKLNFGENIYQLTHHHYELHRLHQEVRGHLAITEDYVGTKASSKWPHFMNEADKVTLAKMIDLHILVLYGAENGKRRRESKLNELTQLLEGNLQKNWDWYVSRYETVTQKELKDV